MKVKSAGTLEAGSIVFFLSDLPHRGAAPLEVDGIDTVPVRKVVHTYLYDLHIPQGFSSFL
jgi:hypothetical protein